MSLRDKSSIKEIVDRFVKQNLELYGIKRIKKDLVSIKRQITILKKKLKDLEHLKDLDPRTVNFLKSLFKYAESLESSINELLYGDDEEIDNPAYV